MAPAAVVSPRVKPQRTGLFKMSERALCDENKISLMWGTLTANSRIASSRCLFQVSTRFLVVSIDSISSAEVKFIRSKPRSFEKTESHTTWGTIEWWNIDEKNVTCVDLVTQSINDLEEIPDDGPESVGGVTSTIIDT